MARPPTPLIVRQVALRHAIDLIEELGHKGFSLPRLAKRLGVSTPSLYHHFANRTELLTEAMRSIVDAVELPTFDDTSTPWREWCLEVAVAMRDMILERPPVAPLIMWYLTTVGVPELNAQCVSFLSSRGIPPEQCALIVNSLERTTLGSAGVEAMRNRTQNPLPDGDIPPRFSDAIQSRELFTASIRTFLAGVTFDGDVQSPESDMQVAR